MITAALSRGRRMAEALMTSAWVIRRPTGESTVVDYDPVPVLVEVYAGRGKLQTYEGYEQAATAGPATVVTQRMTLHLPVGPYRPMPGDVATCVSSSDPLLVGRVVRLAQSYPAKEHSTSYRVFCDAVIDGQEVG